VPEISRFFGIVIRMFAEPGSPHHVPHFHPIDLIAGSLPKKQRRLVEAWAELHQAELASD